MGMTPELAASLPPHDSREYHWLSVIGRVRPGVSREDVTAQLSTIADRLAVSYPATDKGNHFVFEQAGSLPPFYRSMALMFLTALSVVVLLLLAIAGFNVANLLFAQAINRQREMAVRLALGATRGRLLRLVLLESLLLGLGGGTLGVLLSLWSTGALSSVRMPAPIPLNTQVSIDGRTLAYTFLISVLCGLLLGIAPAWTASRPRVTNALKADAGFAAAGGRSRARNVLVVSQVAMAVVLLALTGLFLRSLESASEINLGFRTRGLLLLHVDPRLNGYSPSKTSAFLEQLRERAAALPGVDAAVSSDVPLLSGGNRSDGFNVVGHAAKGDLYVLSDLYMVTPGYFDALGIPTLAGRDFSHEAANGPRVATINKAFADSCLVGSTRLGSASTAEAGRTRSLVSSEMRSRALLAKIRAPSSTGRSIKASPMIRRGWDTRSLFTHQAIRLASLELSGARCTSSIRTWPSTTLKRWTSTCAQPTYCRGLRPCCLEFSAESGSCWRPWVSTAS